MKEKLRLLIIAVVFIPVTGLAQQKDTLIKKLDSLHRQTDTTGKQLNNINLSSYNENTKITFRNYFILLGSDLKQEFTKPFHMTRTDMWKLGKFAVVLVGVGFVDEPIQRTAVRLTHNGRGLQNVSATITRFGGVYEAYTLATVGAFGIIFKKQKMITTTLLATQAYLTGGALESATKFLSGRTRPSYYDANVEAETEIPGAFLKDC